MTDSDDDYCVSYIVTMVDVRSCARPPRLFCPSSTYIGNLLCTGVVLGDFKNY